MMYMKEIFGKATLRGITEYLLYGLAPHGEEKDYESRLDEVYETYERAVKKIDSRPTSELLDLANDMSEEIAGVYMEIGIQVGILLSSEMRKKINGLSDKTRACVNAEESVITCLYESRENGVIQEHLKLNKAYQEKVQKVQCKMQSLKETNLSEEQWRIIDEMLEANNELNSEYGKEVYFQGVKDGRKIMLEIS